MGFVGNVKRNYPCGKIVNVVGFGGCLVGFF